MRLSELQRNGHLYYGGSYSDYRDLEAVMFDGMLPDKRYYLWNDISFIPLVNNLRDSLKDALTQKELMEDLYGFIFTINKDKIKDRLETATIRSKALPSYRTLFTQRLEPDAIDELFLVDFGNGDRSLSVVSNYIRDHYDVYSKAFHATLTARGENSFFRLNELFLES